MRGYEVTLEFLQETGFEKIILIEERGGLDLIIPEPDFTYNDVVRLLGSLTLPLNVLIVFGSSDLQGFVSLGEDYEAVAIDVTTQEDGVPLTLKHYLRYMMTPPHERDVVLNIVSLEFSKTP